MDTLFADISEHNPVVNDQYARWHKYGRWISIRANDGTYKDQHFHANMLWIARAIRHFKMVGYIVYMVWELPWKQTVDTFFEQVGNVHRRKMVVMIDVERWGNKIVGNHSAALNATYTNVWTRLHGMRPSWQRRGYGVSAWFRRQDRRRVIAYFNASDGANLWPDRPKGMRIILANYGGNPAFPGKVAHQFTDKYPCPPFGTCDMNSADGYSPTALARTLGLGTLVRQL